MLTATPCPIVVSGVTKQGGPASPLKAIYTTSLGHRYLDDIAAQSPDSLRIATTNTLNADPHLPNDSYKVLVTMVEATDDSFIFAKSLHAAQTFCLHMERFQFAYGWLTQWRKTYAYVLGDRGPARPERLSFPSVSIDPGVEPWTVKHYEVPVIRTGLDFLNAKVDDPGLVLCDDTANQHRMPHLYSDHQNSVDLLDDIRCGIAEDTRLRGMNGRSLYRWILQLMRERRAVITYTRGHSAELSIGSQLNREADHYASKSHLVLFLVLYRRSGQPRQLEPTRPRKHQHHPRHQPHLQPHVHTIAQKTHTSRFSESVSAARALSDVSVLNACWDGVITGQFDVNPSSHLAFPRPGASTHRVLQPYDEAFNPALRALNSTMGVTSDIIQEIIRDCTDQMG
ncbi:hypothetical protein B0H14DRAFT_3585894 [Mycena olivaceomarginata]|nr:hypothetical protein B0H14DRAFT_3585894 [Mycena olivaceomarginata]